MSGVASSSKARVLAFYTVAWVIVLMVGSGGLITLRQWGWSRIEQEHARTAFAEARAMFDGGDFVRAQNTLVRLVEAKPERLNRAMITFDTDALGMPAAAHAIATAAQVQELPPATRSRLAIVFQGESAALEYLAAMPKDGGDGRNADLWNARLLLMDAQFGDANERFDAYWRGRLDERRKTIESLTPGNDELENRGANAAYQLFNLGLWDEAAEVAEKARAAGAEDKGLGFYTAVMAERDEGRLAAIERYQRVLEALPNHDLALCRIRALSQQNW